MILIGTLLGELIVLCVLFLQRFGSKHICFLVFYSLEFPVSRGSKEVFLAYGQHGSGGQ